ncbi:terminase large subunit [uncultured Paraglaciecola sp.]|uniref:terminase large subunit n=1 Tax=uncultured Paraglaciecola sp. TaxID=1765024 RepID=UPI00262F2BEC|nr:terminase large subunit [uncultured Paraglaciecola sp.]
MDQINESSVTAEFAWPPDYAAEFRRRTTINSNLRRDPKLLAKVNQFYKNNPVEWINDFCITYDPRVVPPTPKIMPFILFPKQREFIQWLYDCWINKENGLNEKSRDVGASWLCCAFSAWMWKYHEGSAIGWGSRKEEYVDKKGDMKAIFPKVRKIIEYLPDFMIPVGFNMTAHATYMKITNPENDSTITGEAGDNIGRGGRTSIFFKDESAHYERPELIEAALGDNTDVQIDISSVRGTANVFYRRRMAGEIWEPDHDIPSGKTRVFVLDWKDHPAKTQEWYDKRKARAIDEGLAHMFAQEVDRDYSGSVERIIIPAAWVRAAIDAHKKLGFEPTGAKIAGQDVADGGGDKNALVGRHGVVCNYAEHWGGDAGEASKIAVKACQEMGINELYYDSIGVGVGFKTGINNLKESDSFPPALTVHPWNAGASPLDPEDRVIPLDDQTPLNKDQYGNLKAQSWDRTRRRFYKTYRAVEFGEKYDHDELISLDSTMPKLHQLQMELSQAVFKDNGERKTIVDKKPSGAISPNMADAFVMCFNPCRFISIFDVL